MAIYLSGYTFLKRNYLTCCCTRRYFIFLPTLTHLTSLSNVRVQNSFTSSIDVLGVRLPGESSSSAPNAELGENNTINIRVEKIHRVGETLSVSHGFSLQSGKLSQNGKWSEISELTHDITNVGEHSSWAAHLNVNWHDFNIQSQYASFKYDINGFEETQMVVGSYNYYGSIPSSADTWLTNISWQQKVQWGPITKVKVFNDHSRMINKVDGVKDTVMNSLGLILSAGPLYTYIEWYHAKNQPFIGGSLVGSNNEYNQRININLGYYF